MDKNEQKLKHERCGKTCRLCVALSLLASIAGIELSPLAGHEHGDKAILPPHTPREIRVEFDMFRPLVVSGASGSTASINFNDLL